MIEILMPGKTCLGHQPLEATMPFVYSRGNRNSGRQDVEPTGLKAGRSDLEIDNAVHTVAPKYDPIPFHPLMKQFFN